MRQACLTAASAAVVIVLAGCSLPSTAPATPDLETGPPASVPAPTSSPADNASAPTPSSTPAAGEQPFATRPGSLDKVRVAAQLFPVRRSGRTATVNLYITSLDPDETFTVSDHLGDGNIETASKSQSSVDGIRLLDTSAKKAYLPAVTADGACVCSPDDDNTYTFNSSVWVTVTFAAPPKDTTTVSVTVPTFGTFTDVPVR